MSFELEVAIDDAWASVLTPRELEVALLAVSGLSNKEVARKLDVAEGTIKMHMHRVLHKLGATSRYNLITKEQGERK